MILLNGLMGQQRNVQEGIIWLKRAATQADVENPHALYKLAQLYEDPSDPEIARSNAIVRDDTHAMNLYTQAGQLGHLPSQHRLGSAYEYGQLNCPTDPKRSIAWYSKAAEAGHTESELALSGWYLTGVDGVLAQSDSEAYLWARKAADLGLPKAEFAVGYYCEMGIGTQKSVNEAKEWYLRAAG